VSGPSRLELWGISLLLVAALVVFFLTPIRTGRLLSPENLLFLLSPWHREAPSGFQPGNALLSDYVFQFKPWREFAVEAVRSGRLPLWNPHIYAGAPFLGNGISAVLYPLNLPFLVLREPGAMLLWAGARFFVAGLCMYLFMRTIGGTPLGGVVASLAFTFSGFLVVWLFWPQVNVAVWLPALFLVTEALIRHPSIGRSVALGAVVCVQFLGGHPETSLHILSAVGLYAVWRLTTSFWEHHDRRRLGRAALSFTAGAVLGLAGAAIQLVPLSEYILHSAALADRQGLAGPLWFLPRPRLLAMISLVCPYCFGSHLPGDFPLGDVLGVGNFNVLNGGYVGLLTLLLAGVAVVVGTRRGVELYFLVLTILAFCLVYRIPPVVNLIEALPLFSVSRNDRALLLFAFAVAVLAGRGADLLLTMRGEQSRIVVRRLLWGIVVTALVILVVGASVFLTLVLLRAVSEPQGLPRYELLVPLVARETKGRLALLALSGLALWLATRTRRRAWWAWAVPAILIIDLMSFGRDYNPSTPPRSGYPPNATIDFLRAQRGFFRVLGIDGSFPPNTSMMYGLSDLRGYDALETEAYYRFLAATGPYPQPHLHFRSYLFSNVHSRLIDALNVKYVVSERELTHPKLNLVWERGTRIYENRNAMARAYVVHRTRTFRTAREVEEALRDPTFDPAEVVLLEGAGPSLAGTPDGTSVARIIEYRSEEVVVEVSTTQDAVLVLADAWFPGWEATLDGRPTKILRANLLVRGIAVAPGRHEVRFRYAPLSVKLGAAISGLAVVAVAGLGVLARARRPRDRLRTPLAGSVGPVPHSGKERAS
jgi:Bacterial membrane protein YfhO